MSNQPVPNQIKQLTLVEVWYKIIIKILITHGRNKMGKYRGVMLSQRHRDMLDSLSEKIGVNFSQTVARALEALEEKEAERERRLGGDREKMG